MNAIAHFRFSVFQCQFIKLILECLDYRNIHLYHIKWRSSAYEYYDNIKRRNLLYFLLSARHYVTREKLFAILQTSLNVEHPFCGRFFETSGNHHRFWEIKYIHKDNYINMFQCNQIFSQVLFQWLQWWWKIFFFKSKSLQFEYRLQKAISHFISSTWKAMNCQRRK